MDGRKAGYKKELMDRRNGRWRKEGWVDGWMDRGRKEGWMDGCVGGCMYVRM